MRNLPPGFVRVGPICVLPPLLHEGGIEPTVVYEAARVDPHLLDDPDNIIAYRDMGRLLTVAGVALDCPHLGLFIGERCGLAELGPIAELAAQAPDVGAALMDFVRHMPTFDRGGVTSLAVDGDSATFSFMIVEPDVPAAEQIREGTVAIMVQVLRALCGDGWEPDLVLFPHRSWGSLQPYLKFFRAPVQFNAGLAGCVFAARWLRQGVFRADPALRDAIMERTASARNGASHSFAERVRRQIQLNMPGASAEAAIARALAMDESTLRRRLAREGSSFRAIVQDVRYEIARQLIGESELTLAEVAAVLGFGELSVFTRAFRRWSGATPSQWRKEHNSTTGR
jgi:AraC-like DNA-binding protein